ncbi:ABC transporter substrate-binding protein [Paracoccus sp. SCSIO 75233]|uniref:ABC transporter substrate-binding protein n=1 Tax=Paracoccus sp. SCSIO 75233 TaxID=3017782 RepID=UPI0022EFE487|nr:ABC transporter substrate-binding protein [Paracoccus sp. SCSIO 75233]WBU52988.1 ABC transporter substrate-binding protein [Paracoccus sp. SCSIO 75233]
MRGGVIEGGSCHHSPTAVLTGWLCEVIISLLIASKAIITTRRPRRRLNRYAASVGNLPRLRNPATSGGANPRGEFMERLSNKLTGAAAALALSLGGAAFAAPTPGEYNIGIISDDTGPIASAGISYHNGAELAVEEINAGGYAGDGVTLNLLVKDSGTDAARAVQAMTQFAADRSVMATTCCIITPIAGAVSQVAMREKLPLVIYGATREGLPQEPFVTSVVALPGPQEVMMAKELANVLDPKRVVYYVTGDNDIFLDRAYAMKEVLEEYGAETVAEISTLANDTDFTGPATQGMGADPDLILVMATQQPSVGIISALRERGFEGNIATSEVLSPPAIYQKSGNIVAGIPFALSFQPGLSSSEEATAFIEAYQEKFGSLPDVYAAQGYTAIQYMAQGMAALDGDPTREALAESMWQINEIERNLVSAGDPPDPRAIAGFVAERLASYKCPQEYEFVSELPRNALGKVLKSELQSLFTFSGKA